ncbi:MAG: Ig-like domain-containing protein [Campylobacterota bacterium]|nr:Ig-like domain-containing protein [Campylobacterota bacterium]
MHTLKTYMQMSIVTILMTMGMLQAAPLMSLAQPAIEPAPLESLENNGEGNVTFIMSERNDEVVAGINRFKVTVTLGKVSLKNDNINAIKVLNARTGNTDVTNKFDIDYVKEDYVVRIQQKATEDLPGDMRYLVVIPVSVRENTPITNPGNGFLVNMSSEGSANADGTSSDYTYTNIVLKAVADKSTIKEDTSIDINVTKNDTNTSASIDSVTQPKNGKVVINPNGTVKYTPNANFVGVDTFTYTAGGLKATVTVTVTSVNDAPVGINDTKQTKAGTPLVIPASELLKNDGDADGDTLTIISVGNPTNGKVQLVGTTVTFTPNANAVGPETFEYTISDGKGGTDTVKVTVGIDAPVVIKPPVKVTPTPTPTATPSATATPKPTATATAKPSATATATPSATPEQTCSDIDAPVAANDSANITKGEVSTINVQANDKGTNVIANSTRLLDAEGKAATTLYVEGKGTWLVDTTTGAILFDPDDACEGTVSVKYVIADKCGKQSNPATVTVSFDGTCESTQSSDSGDALGNISMLLLALLTGTLGLFFVRREELNALVK